MTDLDSLRVIKVFPVFLARICAISNQLLIPADPVQLHRTSLVRAHPRRAPWLGIKIPGVVLLRLERVIG
jgi:hypothetical protein